MAFDSKNMNYVFNVEYFENLALQNPEASNEEENIIKIRNCDIEKFSFTTSIVNLYEQLKDIKGFNKISLYTTYPGVMIGIGNPHSLNWKAIIKCGFSFDYVTGIPYLPGSSVKGILRNYFPGDGKDQELSEEYENLIQRMLGKKVDVLKLKENIFENNDVFLDAFPESTSKETLLLQMEYITPHTEGKFKSPVPINMLKIRPNVAMNFAFLVNDFVEDEKVVVSATEKVELFKKLLLSFGIGAKTNVGFGKLVEQSNKQQEQTNKQQEQSQKVVIQASPSKVPKCKNSWCNNVVTWNNKTNKWNAVCMSCYRRR